MSATIASQGLWHPCRGGIRNLRVPGMLLDLFKGNALLRVCLQYPLDEISRLLADEVWGSVLSMHDFPVQLVRVLVLERQVTADDCKDDDTAAPNVTSRWYL
eukprot:TRINITY_DN41144_c0_g2_i1.p3 TRINITY_DN41144_c0_g2~~TRINITY_DN41144_c0_g2_i1.p3  ORF type:complete len:102 (+),score=3.05 TRINITY_DN41144_c0_g2_i1:813-1118(+)